MSATKGRTSDREKQASQPQLADLAELYIVLGPRVAAARRSKKLTQHRLAARMSCHQTTIAFMETRKLMPGRQFMDRLVTVLDISLFEMLRAPDPWELTLKVGRQQTS